MPKAKKFVIAAILIVFAISATSCTGLTQTPTPGTATAEESVAHGTPDPTPNLNAAQMDALEASEKIVRFYWNLEHSYYEEFMETRKQEILEKYEDKNLTEEQLQKIILFSANGINYVYDWIRPIQILLGDLDANHPRLAVADVRRILQEAAGMDYGSEGAEFIRSEFDKIAGCPDYEIHENLKITSYGYAIDNSMTKIIFIDNWHGILYAEFDQLDGTIVKGYMMLNNWETPDPEADFFGMDDEAAANNRIKHLQEFIDIYKS